MVAPPNNQQVGLWQEPIIYTTASPSYIDLDKDLLLLNHNRLMENEKVFKIESDSVEEGAVVENTNEREISRMMLERKKGQGETLGKQSNLSLPMEGKDQKEGVQRKSKTKSSQSEQRSNPSENIALKEIFVKSIEEKSKFSFTNHFADNGGTTEIPRNRQNVGMETTPMVDFEGNETTSIFDFKEMGPTKIAELGAIKTAFEEINTAPTVNIEPIATTPTINFEAIEKTTPIVDIEVAAVNQMKAQHPMSLPGAREKLARSSKKKNPRASGRSGNGKPSKADKART